MHKKKDWLAVYLFCARHCAEHAYQVMVFCYCQAKICSGLSITVCILVTETEKSIHLCHSEFGLTAVGLPEPSPSLHGVWMTVHTTQKFLCISHSAPWKEGWNVMQWLSFWFKYAVKISHNPRIIVAPESSSLQLGQLSRAVPFSPTRLWAPSVLFTVDLA